MRHPRRPTLTPAILRDDPEVWSRIEKVLMGDFYVRKANHYVLDAQRAIRQSTTEFGWNSFLWFETEASSRAVTAYLLLTKWAFWEGVKHGQRQRGSSGALG